MKSTIHIVNNLFRGLNPLGSTSLISDKESASISSPGHKNDEEQVTSVVNNKDEISILSCIQQRRSIFPRSYEKDGAPVERSTIDTIIDAAYCAPYHGTKQPWRFVVLGKKSMVEMQHLTLDYYETDERWRKESWGSCSISGKAKLGDETEYRKWRNMTEEEIEGRWGPVSYMIAIVMRRHAGKKRIPEWEEMCATACAVQNMHIQASTDPNLACYWSSWHSKARDSDEMKEFLEMEKEDKCLGFFIVAPTKKKFKARPLRSRPSTEWRE